MADESEGATEDLGAFAVVVILKQSNKRGLQEAS